MKVRAQMIETLATSRRALWCSLAGALLFTTGAANAQAVSQNPLSVGGNVPGNLLLVPSVEYPTVMSIANIADNYTTASTYVGYFDSFKCYKYQYDTTTEANSYFYPVSKTATKACSGSSMEWSGNFLNWAATQTIDPFRKALTGGLRTTDTASLTILEKARYHDANEGLFPMRRVPTSSTDATLIQGALPSANWDQVRVRIARLGNRMFFASSSTGAGVMNVMSPEPTATNYNGQTLDSSNKDTVFSVRVRVKVCDNAIGLENNCVAYGASGYKPEGLIQKYANRIRFSAFSYLNDSSATRDGGVLRAKQKFVGPQKLDPVTGWVANTAKEWSSVDGTFVQDPDSTDSSATNSVVAGGSAPAAPQTLNNSGVINYINKFGQMTTKNDKSYDPVSELYYTALRYLRGMSNLSEYTNLTGTAKERYELADGFPVVTTWDDPMQYYCQNNSILGIGDAYTHKDKNLNGYAAGGSQEPGTQPNFSPDTLDVTVWADRVAALESLSGTPTFPSTMPVNSFSGRENSAFIAGLAYYAHTQDLRPLGQPFAGPTVNDFQTASTYWVDVLETQNLEPRRGNMYWLAAKYGGFTLPDPDGNNKFTAADYDPATRVAALPNTWWTNGDNLTSNGKQSFTDETFPRASNYYVANQADLMVNNLNSAFAKIASEGSGSGSSLAANTTRLDTTTRIYQALFRNGTWMGQLQAFDIDDVTGVPATAPLWTAAANMPTPALRNIFMNAGGVHKVFSEANMTPAQKTAFTFTGIGASTTKQNLVDYFRGVQTMEESATSGVFRTRTPASGWSASLGDIVNSTPIFVGAPNAGLYSNASFMGGGSAYTAFVTTQASRTPAIWVGANDGMMHAFNASTGAEIYAFIPNTVIMNSLAQYANPDYVHRYFVDGETAIADVYDGTNWRTILVGTLGRGGPGIFALDITNPASPSFLWEKSSADISVLGKNIGRPVIAQVADGVWRVILGNGIDSGASSQLIQIGAISGTVTVTDTASSTANNGLTAVLARDADADGFANVAYAGDLLGNLWKFSNLSGTITVTKMFTALDPTLAQPITAAPFAAKDTATGSTWVFFGTGKYLNETDIGTTQQQTWYGIIDNGVATTRANLVQRTITTLANIGEFGTRSVSAGTSADLAGKNGWFIDLPLSGERMVLPNRFQGGVLLGISRIPDPVNACKPTGRGVVMAINPFTGAALDNTFFDANRDGVFNDGDKSGTTTGSTDTIVSGLVFDAGVSGATCIGATCDFTTDTGEIKPIKTQGSAADAGRLSWREILN